LYKDDVDMKAEEVQGAVSGAEDMQVRHMVYEDGMNLLASARGALQSTLAVYAHSKHNQPHNQLKPPFQLTKTWC